MPMQEGQIELAVWKNDRKESETHPDLKGQAKNEAGDEFWVSLWKRSEDANPNAPVLKGYLTPKNDKPAKPAKSNKTEEDIPW